MSNITPNFTKNGVIGSALATTANANSDGTGNITTGTMKVVVTADAVSGTFVEYVRVLPVATAPTNTTATVGRLFASSITAGATTSADTFLLAEVALPAAAADNASTSNNPLDIAVNFRLPAGWTLLWSNHVAPAANTNWRATAIGGDY